MGCSISILESFDGTSGGFLVDLREVGAHEAFKAVRSVFFRDFDAVVVVIDVGSTEAASGRLPEKRWLDEIEGSCSRRALSPPGDDDLEGGGSGGAASSTSGAGGNSSGGAVWRWVPRSDGGGLAPVLLVANKLDLLGREGEGLPARLLDGAVFVSTADENLDTRDIHDFFIKAREHKLAQRYLPAQAPSGGSRNKGSKPLRPGGGISAGARPFGVGGLSSSGGPACVQKEGGATVAEGVSSRACERSGSIGVAGSSGGSGQGASAPHFFTARARSSGASPHGSRHRDYAPPPAHVTSSPRGSRRSALHQRVGSGGSGSGGGSDGSGRSTGHEAAPPQLPHQRPPGTAYPGTLPDRAAGRTTPKDKGKLM